MNKKSSNSNVLLQRHFGYFTCRLYLQSPMGRENRVTCSWNISPYYALTHAVVLSI